MKDSLKNHGLSIVFAVVGILGGFLYWRFVGCRTGSCPITSNWYMSALMGGLLGYLTGDSINDFRKKRQAKNEGIVE